MMITDSGRERIRVPLGERFADLWLFGGGDDYLLFDTGVKGTLASTVLPALEELSITADSLRFVVVSHLDVDHSGDIGHVHEYFPNAQVIAHHADAGAMSSWEAFASQRGQEFLANWGLDETPETVNWMKEAFAPGQVDVTMDGSENLALEVNRSIQLWHVPGHTLGHLALYDEDFDTVALSDAILGNAVPRADGSPSFPPTYRHVTHYLETIDRVRQLSPHTLLTAHYGDFLDEGVHHFLNESEAFVHSLESVILDTLSTTPKTLAQLVSEVNPKIASWPVPGSDTALAFPVAGHLERLWESTTVTRQASPEGWRWTR